MAKNAYVESYAHGIAFEVRAIERGRVTDKVVIHDPNELLLYVNKYAGV